MNKAIILLSGGLDSATCLYEARHKGFKPYCLIFDYGQRHKKEIEQAKKIARTVKAPYQVVKIAFPWQGSSLLDKSKKLPDHKVIKSDKIPSTYVPARNIIFLSFAASYAEVIGAKAIFIGANAIDYSGYPDCRPRFFNKYADMMSVGLKTGVEGKKIKIHTPLLKLTKEGIVKRGVRLGVPFPLTWSCYRGAKRPCGVCDSCRLRAKGFKEAGIADLLMSNVE
jgi:7-cyano-7-deazaguanine synthase